MPVDARHPVSREDVVLAYRMLLGREPENEDAIARGMAAWPDLATLGTAFAASEEFGARHGVNPHALPPLDAGPNEVETTASPARLAEMVQHLARYWTQAGQDVAHWSVLTEERFLPQNIAANLQAFYDGGDWDARVLDATLARIGRKPDEFGHCVDYGCGVGRITVHLARRFAAVTGLDISQPHLLLAAAALREAELDNVALAQVTAVDLMPVVRCDLWFSRIVLQHNPPPVTLHVLRRAFHSLMPGGVAVFQLQVWMRGYKFAIDPYLAGGRGAQMEMHAVPQRAILELAHQQGMILRDLREDNSLSGRPGSAISNTFAFEKAR